MNYNKFRCKENHWNFSSGEGCEACDCDPSGSTDMQCDIMNGQCPCRNNMGAEGRKCNLRPGRELTLETR